MKLILLTPPDFFVEEHIIINALFEEGLDMLHIHKPGSEPIYCERLLKLIDNQWRKKIVTHDHFYLKSEFKLNGIHLSPRNPMPPQKYKGHVSCTCHSFSTLTRRKSMCDYVFLSQIYDGITNTTLKSSFSSSELLEGKRNGLIDNKVMALGGITLETIDTLKEYNFGGCVIYGDLWKRFDFHSSSSYKGVINYFKLLKRRTE